MINFSNITRELVGSDLINVVNASQINREAEILFSINMKKEEIYLKKKTYFSLNYFKKIYVIYNTTNYGKVSNKNNGIKIIKVDLNLMKNGAVEELASLFQDSLVILTNNLFAQIGLEKLGALYEKVPNSVWVIQDYDNHHWIENSLSASIFADLYFPSHMDGELSLLAKLNPNIPGFLPCGSNQWSNEFIKSHANDLLNQSRSDDPLGKFYFYEKFMHRNRVINTLNIRYKSIGIIEKDFHQLSDEEKWQEWISYRLHWIIPTSNDLPIRFFDALITGGLPLVPKSLIPFLENLNIPSSYYGTFSSVDILNPNNVIECHNHNFESQGIKGVLERHNFALNRYHVDQIIGKIISVAKMYYQTN